MRPQLFVDRAWLGAVIVRTDGLADVAAENVIANEGAEFPRDVRAALDGEIRDAATRVQPIRTHEGSGRARVETGLTGPAPLGHDSFTHGQIEIQEHLTQKKVTARPGSYAKGIFAKKRDPCGDCQVAFEKRRRIHADARDDASSRSRAQGVRQTE
jgi:hypothetical protein